MKRRFCAGMLLAMGSQMAAAQSSVTLYGVGDIGFEYLTKADAAGNKQLRVTSGNVSGSRWGLRGVEDLGGGNRAVYVLESGFDLDTGMGQGGRLFGRQAYVGLESQWGRITLGRQQNAFFDLLINYDPTGFATRYSAFMLDPVLVGRYDNTAKYTGKFGPITAVALYSFARGTTVTSGTGSGFASESPGDVKSDRAFGGGLEYADGSFGATVTYDQQQGTAGIAGQNSGQTDRRLAVGGNYVLGQSTISVGYRWFRGDIGVAPGGQARRNDVYWLGYRVQVSPAVGLTAAGYYFNNRNSGQDPWSLAASVNYALSKRTDAFLTVGYAHNKDSSVLGLNGFGTVTAGENQTGVTLNLRHKF
ncbi:porin [Cupriavidus consociatus]|uniref:porin n=1 Tax=Cupriavidus consociatus TaxID=2821357 RepID=UPI001AE4F92A|nr:MULTISPECIES: porin [unclassified Cupriavidus]MBP0618567.1 porin [Cupriavidus sp. LEh25]MDK2655203.1 porin [Cupriavidus sp. LEh21]